MNPERGVRVGHCAAETGSASSKGWPSPLQLRSSPPSCRNARAWALGAHGVGGGPVIVKNWQQPLRPSVEKW